MTALNKYIYLVVMSLMVVAGVIGFCGCKKSETPKSDSVVYRDRYITLLSNKSYDSLSKVTEGYKTRYDMLKSANKSLSQENAALKEAYNKVPYSDSGAKITACEDLVAGYEREIPGYVQQIYLCDSIVQTKDAQLQNRQSLVIVKDQTIDSLYKFNKDLAIKVKRTWWEKNRGYVGLIVGVGAGVLVAK